jgi:hypothetical protein
MYSSACCVGADASSVIPDLTTALQPIEEALGTVTDSGDHH